MDLNIIGTPNDCWKTDKTDKKRFKCLKSFLTKTNDDYPSICIRVNKDDYYGFLIMCLASGCHYEDGSTIDPNDLSCCSYLMEIRKDYRIAPRRGISAWKLQSYWHFNYSDIKNGLFLPKKNGCLDLRNLSYFNGDNYFMDETVRSMILPRHLAEDINGLFKGTDYKRIFNIYYCDDYQHAKQLRGHFNIEELNGQERNIRVIPNGGNCYDNIAHSYDKQNGFTKRWMWGKNMLPELLEQKQITNSILVSDGELYMYRCISPESVIYTYIDSQIKGKSYRTQICLHDEKHMLPKIEKYLKHIGCNEYVFIKQGVNPNSEKAFLVNLEMEEIEELGAVNYVDKTGNMKCGISIRTNNDKIMPQIDPEALINYARLHREFNYIFFDQEEKEFRC